MFWSGLTAAARAPAATSRQVTSPVRGPICGTGAPARRPQREARISYTSAG